MRNPNYYTDLLIFGDAKKEIFTEEEDEQLRREHEKELNKVAGDNRCLYMDNFGWQCPGKIKEARFLGCSAIHGSWINDHLTALRKYVFDADNPKNYGWRSFLTIEQSIHYYSAGLI